MFFVFKFCDVRLETVRLNWISALIEDIDRYHLCLLPPGVGVVDSPGTPNPSGPQPSRISVGGRNADTVSSHLTPLDATTGILLNRLQSRSVSWAANSDSLLESGGFSCNHWSRGVTARETCSYDRI
jgi:hypothetical protein